MKKLFSRVLCTVLTVMLVLSSLPLITFAASSVPQYYQELYLDNSYVVSSEDSNYYYRFVPESNGIYRFYSYGYYDTFVAVYDADMFEIASDDDGGSDGNFQLDVELDKNNIYYIKTGSFSSNCQFHFLVTVPEKAIGLYISDKYGNPIDKYSSHINDKMRFVANFEPYGATGEDVTWSVVDPSVASVDKYGNVTFKGLGSTTLKAVSGELSATTSITVEENKIIPENEEYIITLPVDSDHICLQSDIKSDAYYRINYDTFFINSILIYNSKNELVATDNNRYGYIEFHSDVDDTYRIKLVYGNISEEISTNISLEKSIPAQSIDIYYEKNGEKIYTDNYNFYIDDDITLGYSVYPENADPVEISYWYSSDPSVLEVDFNGKLHIYQEGSSNVTLYTANGLSTNVNINISNIYYFSCDNQYNIDLNANNNGTYKVKFNTYYNPAYQLDFNFDEPVDILIRSADNTYRYLINDTATDSVKLNLLKHIEYIIEIKSNTFNEVAGSFILKSRILASSISITDDNGNPLSFYDCEVGDTFKLNYKLHPEDSEPENVRWYTNDENILQVSHDGTVTALTGGSAYLYIETESLSATEVITINVEYYPEFSLDTYFNTEFDSENFNNKYSFTPEESGYYKLVLSGEDTNYSLNLHDENNEYINPNHDYPSENQTVISFYLESDKRYKFYLYCHTENYKSYSAVFSAYKKPTVINITQNHNDEYLSSYVGFAGDTVYLNAHINDPECYPQQDFTWSSSNKSVVTVENGVLTFHNSGTAVITVTSRDGGLGSINIEVADDTEILLNTPTEHTFSNTNDSVRYKFIPTESGYYSFNFNGPSHIITQVSNASFGFVEEVMIDGYSYYKLEANSVYYFKAFFPDILGTYTFTVSKPQSAESIYITDDYGNDITSLNSYVGTREHFNVYSIPNGSVFGEVSWTSSDNNVLKIIDNEYIFCVGEGTAVLTANSIIDGKTLMDSITINVFETSALPISTETNVNYEADYHYKTFSFVPATSAQYAFLSHGDYDTCGYIYDDEGYLVSQDDDLGTRNNFMVKVDLEANKTYYLSSKFSDHPTNLDSESTYSVLITPVVNAQDIFITDMDENIISSYSTSLNERYISLKYKYLPEFAYDDNVSWYVDNEEIARLNDYNDEYYDFQILSTGECNITVSTESGLSHTIKLTVSETPSISLNETVEIEFNDNNTVSYNFTPSETGWYLLNGFDFRGTNWGTFLNIYDENNNPIEIEFESINNQIKWYTYLNAGKTYRLVFEYSYQNYMAYWLNISKTAKIVSMEILRMPYQSEIIENENGQYFYNLSGLIVRATDSNGNSEIFEYDNAIPMVTTICGHPYTTGNYDAENGIFRATLNAGGYQLIIPFTIIENPVESIEAITARDFVFEQYTNGYWQTPDWFHYDIPSYEIYVKINYTDGTSEFAQVNSFVNDEFISFNDDQYMEPWNNCGTYYGTIAYMGRTATVPFTIIPNTVEKIELADSDYVLEIEENTCGWNDISYDNIPFWYYYIESALDENNTELILTHSDGSTETVTIANIMYKNFILTDQYETPLKVGEHSLELSYMDKTFTLPLKITEDGIKNIELIKAPDVSFIYGDWTNGYLHDPIYPESPYVPYEKFDDLELRIYYDDGTSAIKTSDDIVEDEGYYYIDDTQISIAYETPTHIGDDNTATFYFRNYSFEYNYSIVESNVKSVAVKKLPTVVKNGFLSDLDGMIIELEYNDGTEAKEITITSDMVTMDPELADFFTFAYKVSHKDGDFIISTVGDGEYILLYHDCRAVFNIENSNIYEKMDSIELIGQDDGNEIYNILLTFADGEELEIALDISNGYGGGSENYIYRYGFGYCEKGYYPYNVSKEIYPDGSANIYINIFDEYIEILGGSSFRIPGDLTGDGKVNVIDLVRAKRIMAGSITENNVPDFNGDKKFNAADLILLKKSLLDYGILLANKIGDADGDSYVDIYDALHIALYLAGDNRQLSTMADMNLDGIIDENDQQLIVDMLEL